MFFFSIANRYVLVGYEEMTPRFEKNVAVRGHLFSFVLQSPHALKGEL